MKLGDFETSKESSNGKKPVSKILETIAGIFFPTIAALTGCGMLKALLTLLVFLKVLDTSAQTYQLLLLMSDSAFYFLPVILAVSAAKKFRCNEYLAAAIGGILVHPIFINLVSTAKEAETGLHFLGLPVSLARWGALPVIILLLSSNS